MSGAQAAARKAATSGGGPLSGLRVLELGSTVAAPFCGRLLADFGAEVIKVETLEGDTVRTMGRHAAGHSLYAASIFRNKQMLALDMNQTKGRDIIRALADKSDVLIENFRPGRMEQWGLGYEELSARNPGLVMVRISGYGQTGPYSERPGYGATCEAVSGLRELTGDPDRPPSRVAVSLTDEVTAIYAAFGAMMALWQRQTSGRGQVVDAALYESAFSLMEPHVPAYAALGAIAKRAGSRLPDNTPNNLYPSNDGGYVHITAITKALFGHLVTLMGSPALGEDARFSTPQARARNQDTLDAMIGAWTATLPLRELEEKLIAAGIPAARIYRIDDIFEDPHFRDRQMLVEMSDPDIGKVVVSGIVPKLSDHRQGLKKTGGQIGADTRTVLRDLLQMDDGTIADLVREKVVVARD
ncbi:MAG: CoA transferase [Betaproteobacteria bacterium]|nr:CoA transferase [Betaproteobacteria bacterium]